MQKLQLKANKKTLVYLIIFIYTALNGILRKWVFINNYAVGNILFFIQLLSPYFFILVDSEGSKKIFSSKWVGAFFFVLLIEAFNPLQLTIIHGIIGFLLHFGFWFAALYYVENRDLIELEKMIGIFVIIAFTEIILSFMQYGLPKDNFLNRYAEERNVGGIIAEVGDAVRVTGTFSYISGFSAYLIFHAYFVWAAVKLQYRPYITLALLVGGLICGFMNGSRGATMVYELIIGFFIVFEARKSNIGSFLGKLIIPGVVLALIILARGQLGIESNVTTAYANYDQRLQSGIESGEQKSRMFHDFYALANFRGNYPFFGVGIGATYQGNNALFGKSPYVEEYGFIESELERYVLEGGFLLLFFRLAITIYFCSKLVVPFFAKWLIGGLLFMTPIVFNSYNAIFSFIGITILDQVYLREQVTRKIRLDKQRELSLQLNKSST
ncbi:MAG: hypothetical protein JSR09_06080 [Bacteroidetes bacterium]|nr:hypothetical protein [Bacteroidota bacterium]MBS1649257.1 hypothetical protein [Bacteroidota bacterium]